MRSLLRQVKQNARRLQERARWALEKRRARRRMCSPAPLPEPGKSRGAVLCFLPHAGVGPQLAAVCVLARTLKERGHRVLVTRCFELFQRCPVMDMYRLPFDSDPAVRAETCLKCAHQSLTMLDNYGLETIDLRSVLTDEIEATVQQALRDLPENLQDFEFDSVAFGKLSAIDLALATKKSEFSNTDETTRTAWRQYLESSLRAYLLVRRICTEYSISRLLYYADYQLNLSSRLAAEKLKIPGYCVVQASHRNVDFRRFVIRPTVWKAYSFRLLDAWPACRELALPRDRVREIADDQLVRLGGSGSHIYSSAKTVEQTDLAQQLGLDKRRKLLVAYTSSLDEVVATRMGLQALGLEVPDRPQPFGNQVEWLQALIDFVEASDDLQLVVRVHPREGSTPRSPVSSEHLETLRRAFSNDGEHCRPPSATSSAGGKQRSDAHQAMGVAAGRQTRHCRFVWPEEPVSSYDLGEAAHLVLTSWSTIGLEMARLGAPVLVAFNGSQAAIPRDDFLQWGATRDEYFRQLRRLLGLPVTLEQISRAYRWYNLYHLGMSLDLGDVVPSSSFGGLPPFKTPVEAEAIEDAIINSRDVFELNVTRLQGAQHDGSPAEEHAALRQQLRRHIHFIFTGEDSREDLPLAVDIADESSNDGQPPKTFSNVEETTSAETGRRLEVDGTLVTYHVGNGRYERNSPMIARLAPLAGRVLNPVTAVNKDELSEV